jgi:cytoskeletal protein CcmA (bactofilin family)
MLRSETLFGKRENAPSSPNLPNPSNSQSTPSSTLSGGSPLLQTGTNSLPKVQTAAERASLASASSSPSQLEAVQSSNSEGGSKLIVGPNIKLKGVEISDCDTLVVEGRVEATMNSRVIQIAEMGSFTGSAEVDLAEIRGEFEGELTVRQKLVIFGSGKVSGTIRYGKLVVEEGGQLAGDVHSGGVASTPRALSVAKASL